MPEDRTPATPPVTLPRVPPAPPVPICGSCGGRIDLLTATCRCNDR